MPEWGGGVRNAEGSRSAWLHEPSKTKDGKLVTGNWSLVIGDLVKSVPSADSSNRQLPVTSYKLPVSRRWFKVPRRVQNWKWRLSMNCALGAPASCRRVVAWSEPARKMPALP